MGTQETMGATMNQNQLRSVRLQLGLSRFEFGRSLGFRAGTIERLETGAPPITGDPHSPKVKLDHIVSFACAWMLFNGGAYIPWPGSEDGARMRSFRDFHKMTNSEMAALFDVSIREMEYYVSPQSPVKLSRSRLMALCWMRLFGSRDPFAFPMHEHHDTESANTCPMRLDPMTIEGDRVR